ncbi:MAG: hypothetical protein IJ345_03100 [Clostridia bacterium]|nr:hypothetical protein [Clostridia bacterium]
MKKFISGLLSLAMIISLAAVICIPTAAVDGDWIVYSSAGEYRDDFEGDYSSVIGYEYTTEGLRIIPADWRDFGPQGGIQTKTKHDVKEGVYMLIRVDEFSYDAGDKWLNMNIMSKEMVAPGTNDVEKYGFGVQTLIRTNADGTIHTLWWHTGGWDGGAQSTVKGTSPKDDDGKLLLELTVTWDGTTFAADINGWKAPDSVVKYMNETFVDMEAFIGFNFMVGKKGGTAGMTVLKFGTSKETAIAPTGDDSRDPVNRYTEIAEIADPDTVEPGMPGVLLNGNRNESDAKTNTGISGNPFRTRNDDWSVTYIADNNSIINSSFSVANDVSYDIQDFPLALVLTRNFCTCEEEDGEVECWALEKVYMYLMTGEFSSADDNHRTAMEACYEPIVDEEGNSYLYFFVDMSAEDAPWEATGRIHGMRADFYDILFNEPGRNSLDVCFMAFFRNLDEAEAYIYNYIGVENEEETTEEETTEEETTVTDETTVAGGDETTASGGDETTGSTEAPAKKNCKSTVGFGSVAVIATVGAVGFASFKKKKK